MGVFGYIVFVLAFFLPCTLLWRCTQQRLWPVYPFFLTYLSYTFLFTLILFPLSFLLSPPSYAKVYWLSDLPAVLLRLAVAWEVFRQTFPRHSGLRNLAGGLLASVLFALAILFFYLGGPRLGSSLVLDSVRKMGLSAAVCLLIVLGVARYYAVPIGRNIWGMAIGLLVYEAIEIANFAAIELAPSFFSVWRFIRPCGYDLMLLIWTWTLWSYLPNPRIVALEKPLLHQALSDWEHRWASVGTALRKAMKL